MGTKIVEPSKNRYLICTEGGHFKQWIMYEDGSVELGDIGKPLRRVKHSIAEAERKTNQNLEAGRAGGTYLELTKSEYDRFMHGFELLCKHPHLR